MGGFMRRRLPKTGAKYAPAGPHEKVVRRSAGLRATYGLDPLPLRRYGEEAFKPDVVLSDGTVLHIKAGRS